MKLLFVTPYVPSQIRVRPFNFLRQMATHHQITLLCAVSQGERGDLEAVGPLCHRTEAVPLRRRGCLRGCVRAATRREPLQSGFCRTPDMVHRLRAVLSEDSFDVVHVEHLRAGWAADLIPSDLPSVFDSVDSISLLLHRTLRGSHSMLQRFIAALEIARCQAYEARLARRFTAVAVTSAEDAGVLRSLAPDADITVVPNGVDLDYFRPTNAEREPATLVFSGKMSYHANVTALLHFVRDVLPLIEERRPDVRLVVVGSNPPRAVQSLVRRSGVTVTGYVRDIRREISRATVAVCPVTVKVGIQNKVLEAMAVGTPVVSTPAGVIGLEIEPGRDALVAGTAVEFADEVCRLLANRTLQDKLSVFGRRYVETHHRWDAAAGQLEGIYARARTSRLSESAA
jgi:sugar transferase (PEP-CTERM/EpsH1 system associated)